MEQDSDSHEICAQTVFRDRQFDPPRRHHIEKDKTRKEWGFDGNDFGLLIRPKRSSYVIWRPVLLKENI